MALEKVMCPFCERDIDEHKYEYGCLTNLRFLASGTLEYHEGYFTEKEMEKLTRDYQESVKRNVGTEISSKEISKRMNYILENHSRQFITSRSISEKMKKMLDFYLKHYSIKTEKESD